MKHLIPEIEQELQEGILRFWMHETRDETYGGFIGQIKHDGTKNPQHPKGSVLNARILWTFSAAYRMYPNPDLKGAANRAFAYLMDYFIDKKEGGVYWMVDYEGNPLDTKKQIYALSFAIYGLTEYYLAFKAVRALEEAVKLYSVIEEKSFDHQFNGYFEAFTRDWTLMDDLRLSEKDENEKKTMNTHLHILEAYTNLYRVYQDKELKGQLKNLIELFLEKIVNKQSAHLELFFDEYWASKSEVVSYGHDIEASWLLLEAAEVLGERCLIDQCQDLAIRIAEITMIEGVQFDGGLIYEKHGDGTLDEDRHWWPQAEALVGFVNAYQVSGEKIYLKQAEKTWMFIQSKLIDQTNGEWYWSVDSEGNPNENEDKVGPWKCPYHNARALIEVIRRVKSI